MGEAAANPVELSGLRAIMSSSAASLGAIRTGVVA